MAMAGQLHLLTDATIIVVAVIGFFFIYNTTRRLVNKDLFYLYLFPMVFLLFFAIWHFAMEFTTIELTSYEEIFAVVAIIGLLFASIRIIGLSKR